MPYYDTLAEDVARAKQILAKGQPAEWEKAQFAPDVLEALRKTDRGGIIYGADTYAAYKLLESFVEAIEAVDPKVCELAMRHARIQKGHP
jgi:transcriptional regulator NrdR family protein